MRRLVCLITLLCLAAIPASAQRTISVRAGEHADFTRLVLALPDNAAWQLDRGGRRPTLQLDDDTGVEFDLSRTFARIPRTRLQAVRPRGAGLELQLGCACPLRVREDLPGQLVIDIREPAPAAVPARLRPPARPPELTGAPVAARAGRTLAAALQGATPPQPNQPSLAQQVAPAPKTAQIPPDSRPSAAAPADAGAVTDQAGVALAGAVAAGLLQAEAAFTAPSATRPTVSADAARHLEATDALAAARGPTGADPSTAPPQSCTEAAQAALGDWQPDTRHGALGAAVAALGEQPDGPAPATIRALAQRYLELGFGAEARLVLAMLPSDNPGRAALLALTWLVDGMAPRDAQALHRHAGCSAADGLYAFLARPDMAPADPDAIVAALASLPPRLRARLGPTAVTALIAHDDAEAAARAQAALARADPSPDPGAERVARAQLGRAQADLQDIARMGQALSADTPDTELLFLLDHHADTDAQVPPRLVPLAENRLYAHRRTETGRQFARALARLHTQRGDWAEAFGTIHSPDSALDPATRTALRAQALDRLTGEAADSVFVTTVFAQAPWATAGLPRTTRTRIAARLRALGFARQAKLLDGADTARVAATPEPREPRPAPSPPDPPETAAPAPDALLAQGRAALDAAGQLRTELQALLEDRAAE